MIKPAQPEKCRASRCLAVVRPCSVGQQRVCQYYIASIRCHLERLYGQLWFVQQPNLAARCEMPTDRNVRARKHGEVAAVDAGHVREHDAYQASEHTRPLEQHPINMPVFGVQRSVCSTCSTDFVGQLRADRQVVLLQPTLHSCQPPDVQAIGWVAWGAHCKLSFVRWNKFWAY